MPIQIIINGLLAGSLYSLIALGFSLIYSGTRIFHIAHGAVYTSAPYLFLAWTSLLITVFNVFEIAAFISAIILSLISIYILVLIIEKLVYYPLSQRKAPPLVPFISSLGLYIIVVNLIALLFGNETKILNPQIEPSLDILGAIITRIQLIQFIIAIIIIASIFIVLKRTTLGRNIRALSDNSVLLSVLGIDIKKIRVLIFVIGSFLAASASLLKAFDVGMDPHVGLSAVLTATVAMIVGGIGKHHGAVFAALLIGLIQNIVIWYASAQWQDAVTFVILILVLLVRKEGLFASKLRLEER